MYELGLGVLQDYAEAAKWYRLGAEQGDSRSQNSLGTSYLTGEGVPEDYVESTKWYRRAAEQGHNKAQYNLASNIIWAGVSCSPTYRPICGLI